MAKFRKRPVVIEAVQLLPKNWDREICAFAGVGDGPNDPHGCWVVDGKPSDVPGNPMIIGLIIPTLEGEMLAVEGDWIIKGVKGELYPCKPDIFEMTYEPIEESPQ